MSKPVVAVIRGRARANELGNALINPEPSLTSDAILNTPSGDRRYLPVYRSAIQSAGGKQEFTTSVTDDGTLTFYLETSSPPGVAANGASPQTTGTSFQLVLDVSGAGRRFPLQNSAQGSMQQLSVKLAGEDLRMARAALFDIKPNVGIEITQALDLAAQQTQSFIEQNWTDDNIRSGLLAAFGGIPFDSPSMFSMMASQSEPSFAHDYLVMKATYRALVSAPPLPGYIQWQVNWGDRAHNYYQDNQDRQRVFYLPDRFEFAKGPAGAPTVSLLQFSLPEGPALVERTRATFRVYGSPVVDSSRIQNAAQSLKEKIGSTPQMVSLQDAHHGKMTFTQYLPNAQATASNPAVQQNASIDLSTGLRNELDLSFDQFRALWAAIFSAAPENPLFRGWVNVELSDGRFQDRIDFNGRLPKEQETPFFDDILDTSVSNTYPATFSVKTFARTFQGDPAVIEVDLTFAGGKSVTLSPENLKADTIVERSIRDIVIGKQSPDEYPYRLRVIRDDGTISCCEGKAKSDAPSLWLAVDQITGCTGECS